MSVASSTGSVSDSDVASYNPFEGLPPTPRSEEDDIRKGIFGRVLRLLRTVDAEERARWRKAIEEAATAKQMASRGENKKKPQLQEDAEGIGGSAAVDRSCSGTVLVETSGAVKRPRDEEEGGISKVPKEENQEKHCEVSQDQRKHDPSDGDYIAAYLRTLLDKVIGLSLQELPVDALRVLCIMLGIPLSNSKSKMVYYSKLASFYYTNCEKLGKRVSKSFHVFEQFRRDEEVRQKIFSQNYTSRTSTSRTNSKATSLEKQSRSSAGKNTKKGANQQTSGDGESTVSSTQGTAVASKRSSKPRVAASKSTPAVLDNGIVHRVDEELEVKHHGKVFVAHASSRNQFASASGGMDDEVATEDAWTSTKLEGAVASIIHLHDPVTTAIVVRKLAQMGYKSATAEQTVEVILHRFHDRQFIFYDNGMAFLL